MYSATVLTPTLLRNIIHFVLLVGIISAAILVVEPVAARSPLVHEPDPHHESLVSSQTEDGWVAIKTDDGVLFVWNAHELHFTLAVKGKDIKHIKNPDNIFFAVDGKMLQIQAAAIREFAPDAKGKLDDKAVLAAHRDWESKYIEELLKSKLSLHSYSVNLGAQGAVSLWEYDMPEGMNAEVKTQLYVTALRGDYVVMLNGEATTTTTEVEARKFLLDTMATLTTSSETIDVRKLSESIRAGRKP